MLKGFGILLGYFVVMASTILILKRVLKIHSEWLRKTLHFVCFLSIFVVVNVFEQWHHAALAVLLFAALVYPVIVLLEKYPRLMAIFCERRDGEIKNSLMLVFGMMAGLITVFWGLLGEEWKFIVIVAIVAWGFGDAAAALVGKARGKHPVNHRFVDQSKTREGTLAMYVVSMLAIMVSLLVYAPMLWHEAVLVAMTVGMICAISELVSHNGMDTINVPFTTAVSIYLMINILF